MLNENYKEMLQLLSEEQVDLIISHLSPTPNDSRLFQVFDVDLFFSD